MKIIPVIDLMNGQVVHGYGGLRDQYAPLKSILCSGSNPYNVLEGLLTLYPFEIVYIADLDAIMGRGEQSLILEEMHKAFPDITFFIDRGWQTVWGPTSVIGSESLSEDRLHTLMCSSHPFILSLDYYENKRLGPGRVWEQSELWPSIVIVMNLSSVGHMKGPDCKTAQQLLKQSPNRHFISAGGVRSEKDLEELRAIGVSGVLMASALHTGKVDASIVKQFSNPTGLGMSYL